MGGAPSLVLKEPELWLGGEDVLSSSKFFEDHNIQAILTVCQVSGDDEDLSVDSFTSRSHCCCSLLTTTIAATTAPFTHHPHRRSAPSTYQ